MTNSEPRPDEKVHMIFDTYIMFPDDFVRPGVGFDVTLEVHVVPLSDVLWIERRPEHRFRSRGVWEYKENILILVGNEGNNPTRKSLASREKQ